MEEINLLQNRMKDRGFAWQGQSRIVITALVIILIVLGGAYAVFFILNRNVQTQLSDLTAQTQTLQTQLNQKETGLDQAKIFQAQLVNFKSLLSGHVYMTPVFDELDRMTYIHAQYLSLTNDETGTVNLEGLVASYNDLGKLLLGLSTSKSFHNVRLLSVGLSGGTKNAYQFDVSLTIDPTLLSKK